MKLLISFLMFCFAVPLFAQQPAAPPTLKSLLLEELRKTHSDQDWFATAKVAVDGLTPEQASWTDGKGNHSVGQLAYHIWFWDTQSLAKFKGETPSKFSGNNDDSFNGYDPKQWPETVKKLDDEMTEWEKAVEAADDTKLQKWASTIQKIGEHRAYHIGEMVMVRKEQGSWNPEKGVK